MERRFTARWEKSWRWREERRRREKGLANCRRSNVPVGRALWTSIIAETGRVEWLRTACIIFPRSSSTNVHVRGCLRNVDSRTTTEVDLEEEDAKRTKKRKKKNSRHFFVARVDIACLYSSLRYISIDCFKKEVEKFFFSKRNGKLIKLRHGVRGVADWSIVHVAKLDFVVSLPTDQSATFPARAHNPSGWKIASLSLLCSTSRASYNAASLLQIDRNSSR